MGACKKARFPSALPEPGVRRRWIEGAMPGCSSRTLVLCTYPSCQHLAGEGAGFRAVQRQQTVSGRFLQPHKLSVRK